MIHICFVHIVHLALCGRLVQCGVIICGQVSVTITGKEINNS